MTNSLRQYLPEHSDSGPRLTTAETRIPIHTPQRRPNETGYRTIIQEALDGWGAATAAANVVMQIGWPEVAYGVMESKVESGSLMKHPWKRARTTTQYLAVAILGTDEERAAYREAVNSAHRHVRSTEDSPVKYNAFNRELQFWVAACLYVGFEDTHEMLQGKMDEEQAEQLYQTARPLGTTLQVTDDMWPATRKEFEEYWNVACERVAYDETQQQFVADLLGLKMINPLIALPFRGLLRFLTVGYLPPLFREKLGLRWRPIDQRRFDNLYLFVGFVNRFLPKPIRFASYHLLMADLRWRVRKDKSLI